MKRKIIISILFFTIFFSTPFSVFAQGASNLNPDKLKLQVPIENLTEFGGVKEVPCTLKGNENETCYQIPWIAEYLGAVFNYVFGIGAVLAVLMLMVAGVGYILAGANIPLLQKSKDAMWTSVYGLALMLGVYLILMIINPELLKLKTTEVIKVKETKILSEFCSDIKAQYNDAITIGDTGGKKCGDTTSVALASKTADYKINKNTCVINTCPDPKNGCVNLQNLVSGINKYLLYQTDAIKNFVKNLSSLQYQCLPVYAQGSITTMGEDIVLKLIDLGLNNPGETYLDYIALYENEVFSAADLTGYDNAVGASDYSNGNRSYNIFRPSADPNYLTADNYYLQIEINDPGSALRPTWDDTYRIDSLGNPIGISGSACCTYKCAGEGKFTVAKDCQWLTKNMLNIGAVKVDIDANKFFCGTTPLQESVNSLGDDYEVDECGDAFGASAVGEACGSDTDCRSGDCETYKVANSLNAQSRCECDDINDCGKNEFCKTNLGTWNLCLSSNKKPVGGDCGAEGNDECLSNNCYNGICQCGSTSDCPIGEVCQKFSDKPNVCIKALAIGESCVDNWQCVSDDCESDSWYDIGSDTKRCQCNNDKECGGGFVCVDVEENCGWNYCVSKNILVPSINENESFPDGKGLCDDKEVCASKKCNYDWGLNDCNACEP
jgi:hypothetical protein